ncbi:hypothetical protein Tco_0340002 [Tanacetum coccineum]
MLPFVLPRRRPSPPIVMVVVIVEIVGIDSIMVVVVIVRIDRIAVVYFFDMEILELSVELLVLMIRKLLLIHSIRCE